MRSNIMLVLHSHIPYVKHQGRWPFGETWLFEAMAETYVPFLTTLLRLKKENVQTRLVLGFSPTLLEQLGSDYIRREFVEYLKEREKAAMEEERIFLAQSNQAMADLAAYYYRFYRNIRKEFLVELDGNIIEAVNALNDDGYLELVTTAVSHAYLPLLDQSSLEHQVYWGKKIFEKYFHQEPQGFWLPECGYFSGVEDILIKHGFTYFFVDSHAVEGGRPPAEFSFGAEEEADIVADFDHTGLSTYRAYRIQDKPITVFGRNAMVSHQVWSADYGYPGDAAYREFHKESPRSGLKYWRVTDRNSPLDQKILYDPARAASLVKHHATHFVNSLAATGREAVNLGYHEPLIIGCYDTELFGHWWWEGVAWLEEVLRGIHSTPELSFILPSRVSMPDEEAQVFESSWGMGGKHYVWDNQETGWMWDIICQASKEYQDIKRNYGADSSEISLRAQAQALRELILIESSDWLFMVSNNLTRDYAMKRFFEHYAKFLRITSVIREGSYSDNFIQWLEKVEFEDNILEDLNTRR
ncbi:MAG TPA: DUF1957 domain-containing protein [Syntrophomonadaceae bacterium]|nr:DUF1957 domain-containing protein [Syntrophomonadaceae bacterium]